MKKNLLIGVLSFFILAFVADGGYRALELRFMDTSVAPNDDFYNYVNGQWMENTEIPSDRGRWGSFDELGKRADSMALAVLKDAVSTNKYAMESDQGKAVTLFKTVLNTKSRNEQGVNPVLPYLKEVDAIENKQALLEYMRKYAPYGESVFYGFYVSADIKNSNENTLYMYSASKGLPDRDYYLKDDEKYEGIRTSYKEFMKNAFSAFGLNETEKAIETIFNTEKNWAENEMTRVEKRNPQNRYNPGTPESWQEKYPSFELDKMLSALNLKSDQVVLGDVKYFTSVYNTFENVSLDDLKWIVKWNIIRGSLGMLSEDLGDLSFDFYGKTLRGTPEQKPLEERALKVVNGSLGEALGKLYVDAYFPEEAKEVARKMVDDVIAAYRVRINNLDWMSAETKAKAQKKLDKLTVKIGYPDKWKDYSDLPIVSFADGGSYFQNMLNVSKWGMSENHSKLGKPVDKSEWGMSPQTVNAYYNPVFNEIVFPAAILQAPFFDFRNDPAVNFGGIGAVIGHEISHGFDDAGAQFDENGNLVNWWTEEDLQQFKERGKKLADQFSAFEALPGKYVNGEFTLGENIGDLGGIASAYDGLQIHLKREPMDKKIDGFTQNQRFFLSWATIWRNKIRDEELAMRLVTDPHSPGYFRAIGPLQNHEGFYKAFNVKEGNKMYRSDEERVNIW